MLCPHGRGNSPEKVGYDESVSNLMFNEEVGYMDTHTPAIRLWIIVLNLKKLLSCKRLSLKVSDWVLSRNFFHTTVVKTVHERIW
jgi:hypothetical protein